jgi:hypothetical protein
MRAHMIRGDVWVDIYTEDSFLGRGRRLGPGEHMPISNTGSIIVGPKATAILTNRHGVEISRLPPLKLVADLSELKLRQRASHLRVVGPAP